MVVLKYGTDQGTLFAGCFFHAVKEKNMPDFRESEHPRDNDGKFTDKKTGYDSRDDFGETVKRAKSVIDAKSPNKSTQLAIINATNPAPNDRLTWIRSEEDIKPLSDIYTQALKDNDGNETADLAPDFTLGDLKRAMQTGYITVYSSYPIKNGIFVTPSRVEASSYAGGGKVHSKRIPVGDVAWIDELQGQYAAPNGVDEYAPSRAVPQPQKRDASNTYGAGKEKPYFSGDKYYANGAEYDVIDGMPDGWVRIDKNAPEGYAFASNNKGRFGGQRKIALVKL